MEEGMPKLSEPILKHIVTFEENVSQNNDLHEALSNNLFPHFGSDQAFIPWGWVSLSFHPVENPIVLQLGGAILKLTDAA